MKFNNVITDTSEPSEQGFGVRFLDDAGKTHRCGVVLKVGLSPTEIGELLVRLGQNLQSENPKMVTGFVPLAGNELNRGEPGISRVHPFEDEKIEEARR